MVPVQFLMNNNKLWAYYLFAFIFQGRSRSLTHLDCLDPNDLTPDANMTTDTADRLIVPCTEPPRVRRHKLARSQVTNSTLLYFTGSHTLRFKLCNLINNNLSSYLRL
jgi:hypothetical protein